jgi:hypothetical protein
MSKMITYAKSFEGIASTQDDIEEGAVTYHTQCDNPSSMYNLLKVRSFDEGVTTFMCDSTNNFIASLAGSLDTIPSVDNINDLEAALSPKQITYLTDYKRFFVPACYFKCIQDNVTLPPVIEIHFTISNFDTNKQGDSPLVENNVTIPFETTVGFRNYTN